MQEIGKDMQKYSVFMIAICETCNIVLTFLEDENKIPLLITDLIVFNLYSEGAIKFYVGKNSIVPV